jgi:hypothetical protein
MTLDKTMFSEYVDRISARMLTLVERGIRLVLDV